MSVFGGGVGSLGLSVINGQVVGGFQNPAVVDLNMAGYNIYGAGEIQADTKVVSNQTINFDLTVGNNIISNTADVVFDLEVGNNVSASSMDLAGNLDIVGSLNLTGGEFSFQNNATPSDIIYSQNGQLFIKRLDFPGQDLVVPQGLVYQNSGDVSFFALLANSSTATQASRPDVEINTGVGGSGNDYRGVSRIRVKHEGNVEILNNNLNFKPSQTDDTITAYIDAVNGKAVFKEVDITEKGFIGLGNLQISSEDYPQFDTQQPAQGGDGMLTIGAQNVDNVLSQTANLIGLAVVMNTSANNSVLGDDQYSVNMAFGNRAGVGQIYGAIGGYDGRANTGQGFRGGLKFYTKSGQAGQDLNAFRDTTANPVGSGLMGCKMKLTDLGSLLIAQESVINQPQAKLHVDGDIIYDARVINLSSGAVGVNTIPTGVSTLASTSSFRSGYYSFDILLNFNEDDGGGGTTAINFGAASRFAMAIEVDSNTSPYAWREDLLGDNFVSGLDNGAYHRCGIVNINGSSSVALIWGNRSGTIAFGDTTEVSVIMNYLGE